MPAFPLRRSTPQDGNPSDNKGSLFVGIASMILALCSLILCARFVGRRVTKNVVGADDYLVVIAHVRGNLSILSLISTQNDIKDLAYTNSIGFALRLRSGIPSASVGLPKGSETLLTHFAVVHYGIGNHNITISRDTLVAIQKV